MKYVFLFLLLITLLTACGDMSSEIAEGMASDDAAIGRSILLEGMEEGMAREAAGGDPAKKPVPDAFAALPDGCSLLPAAELAAIFPCLAGTDTKKTGDRSDKSSSNHKYRRNVTCYLTCAPAEGSVLPMGSTIGLSVWFEGGTGPLMADVFKPQYEAGSQAGLDEIWFAKAGNKVEAAAGDYKIILSDFVRLGAGGDMEMGHGEIDREAIGALMAAVAKQLPK